MIQITDKKKCCGCNACAESCPKGCIEMRPDEMGAMYPHVDTKTCIECCLCVRVCPFENPSEPSLPIECYAAINKNEEERLASSSGGVFIELARRTIDRGGVVFGAVFAKDWSVVHTYAETMDDVLPMMGSKYVQSDTNGIFSHAKRFLEEGREVLFTGTPCQIAGLKHYLRKDYSNLLAVEVICHGVPMPGVWKNYLEETLARPKGVRDGKNTVSVHLNEPPVITGISFRDKRLGWKKFGFVLRLASGIGGEKNSVLSSKCIVNEFFGQNPYMRAFLKNLTLRPSCFACRAKSGSSGCDISIGDFWGYSNYQTDDDRGTSAVLLHSAKGDAFLRGLNAKYIPETYAHILAGNPAIEYSPKVPKAYNLFWEIYPNGGLANVDYVISRCPPTFMERLIYFVKHRVLRIKE